jgi:hypothetical protein
MNILLALWLWGFVFAYDIKNSLDFSTCISVSNSCDVFVNFTQSSSLDLNSFDLYTFHGYNNNEYLTVNFTGDMSMTVFTCLRIESLHVFFVIYLINLLYLDFI